MTLLGVFEEWALEYELFFLKKKVKTNQKLPHISRILRFFFFYIIL
jgi:hypothetical protein